jgi:hypothetical protein
MNREEMLVPAQKAIDSRSLTSLASSTQVALLDTAEYVEINCENQPIYVHIGAAATTANGGYDWFVTKHFRITESMRKNDTYIAIIEKAASATATVIQYPRN